MYEQIPEWSPIGAFVETVVYLHAHMNNCELLKGHCIAHTKLVK
jgi:hypothetical protein